MASYEIIWKKSAERELESINRQYIPRILEAVESLTENPFPFQHRKIHSVESIYRIRLMDYRIVYQVDTKKKLVVIYHVRHRKDVYR